MTTFQIIPEDIRRVFPDAVAVGGAVRDAVLGILAHDLDLASAASPEAVIAVAEAAGFRVIAPTILAVWPKLSSV